MVVTVREIILAVAPPTFEKARAAAAAAAAVELIWMTGLIDWWTGAVLWAEDRLVRFYK